MSINPAKATDYNHNGEIDQEDVDIHNSLGQNIRQSGITWISMAMLVGLTIALCSDLIPLDRIKALESLLTTVYIAFASLVGAQLGLTSWMSRPK